MKNKVVVRCTKVFRLSEIYHFQLFVNIPKNHNANAGEALKSSTSQKLKGCPKDKEESL